MDAHFKFLFKSAASSRSMLPIRNQQGHQLGPYDSVEHTDGNLSSLDQEQQKRKRSNPR